MIRIVAEADVQYRKSAIKSADLNSALAGLNVIVSRETDKKTRSLLSDIYKSFTNLSKCSRFKDALNNQDLCFAIDTLCTSLTELDQNHKMLGVGEGNAPIPMWKCKEWKCVYETADNISVNEVLKNLFEGGSDLKAKINNRDGRGGDPFPLDKIDTNNPIVKEIIGDKESKNDRPFGAKGKYETFVQFITSDLFCEKIVYSEIPDPNQQAAKDAEEQSTVKEGTSSLVIPSTKKAAGNLALFSLERDKGCTCTYLNNNEIISIFNDNTVHVISNLEDLYSWVRPSGKDDWDRLRVRNNGNGGAFSVECMLRKAKDIKIVQRLEKNSNNAMPFINSKDPSQATNPKIISKESPPDVKTAAGTKVEVKNGSGGSKFCIKFSLPSEKNDEPELDDPEERWPEGATDEAYEVLE